MGVSATTSNKTSFLHLISISWICTTLSCDFSDRTKQKCNKRINSDFLNSIQFKYDAVKQQIQKISLNESLDQSLCFISSPFTCN